MKLPGRKRKMLLSFRRNIRKSSLQRSQKKQRIKLMGQKSAGAEPDEDAVSVDVKERIKKKKSAKRWTQQQRLLHLKPQQGASTRLAATKEEREEPLQPASGGLSCPILDVRGLLNADTIPLFVLDLE
jgi:hypothetical protein